MHRLRWCRVGWLMSVVMLVLATVCVASEPMPLSSIDRQDMALQSARVVLGGITVFRFTATHKGITPEQKVSTIYQRLWRLLESTCSTELERLPDSVQVGIIGSDFCVFAGDRLIVTVDEAHAVANASSPHGLAEVWAANLRKALASHLAANTPKPTPGR